MYKFSLDKYTRHNEFLRKEENQEQVKKCMMSMRENCLIGCQMGHITTKNIKDYFHELWTQSAAASASQISSKSDHNYQIKNLPISSPTQNTILSHQKPNPYSPLTQQSISPLIVFHPQSLEPFLLTAVPAT
ncbi:MAG: hypothetical protein EZS28_007183 [Streblomastix strix]|uniref:Uncharacterized protein n=1 Tax=Streblomastix strix TaxID=222440 RepID=A0A5J4WRU0_9EUKA|nr:MAG: hypothetical protein EZS28_007183 [Streblomastix strix]